MTRAILSLVASSACLACAAIAAPAAAAVQHPAFEGWYVGGNLGASWSDSDSQLTVGPGTTAIPTPPIFIPPADVAGINALPGNSSNKSGFTGGIEGGYNYIGDNHILWGIETDFGWGDTDNRTSRNYQSAVQQPIVPPPPLATYTISTRVKTSWIWTIRPRIGWSEGPWAIYGTAGMAMTDAKSSLEYVDTRTPPNAASRSANETLTGWTAGLGGAYAFSENWSVKGEWLYMDFGNIHEHADGPNGFVHVDSDAKVKANVIRIGVDYSF
jgi:outer membrane immunogenic protein